LNAITVGDDREWNVNVFSVSGSNDVRGVINGALDWLENAWDILDPDDSFGKTQVCTSRNAKGTFDEISDLVGKYTDYSERSHEIEDPSGPPRDTPSPESPAPRPSTSHDSSPVSRKRSFEDAFLGRSPTTSVTPTEGVECPCCKGTGMISDDAPEWVSFVTTSKSLYAAGQALDLDQGALNQMMVIVQEFEDEGLNTVRDVLSNLVKNFTYVKNPSAFVASACIKFKHAKTPKVF
jgi:hypothetical protein